MGNFDAVIVAAGASRRMGFDKILAPLAGKTVLEWSLEAFARVPSLGALVVVCPEGRSEEFQAVCGQYPAVSALVSGGLERADSVRAGIAALPRQNSKTLIAVHDAARPLILPETIRTCIEAAESFGAAALAAPTEDTLHLANAEICVEATPPREHFWRAQTPQVARRHDLLRALSAGSFTDEAAALASLGLKVKLVPNSFANFKITRPEDLEMAAAILARRTRHQ